MFEGQPPPKQGAFQSKQGSFWVLDISYSFLVSNPIQIPIFLILSPGCTFRLGVTMWKGSGGRLHRGFLGCKFIGFPMTPRLGPLGIFSSNGVGSPNPPPPRKLLESDHNFRVQNGTKINILKFVDSQMAIFFNEKKVMFQVFSASMASFMGVKSTQNKTCCLAEVNLELMDDPLGPNCWRSVRQHQQKPARKAIGNCWFSMNEERLLDYAWKFSMICWWYKENPCNTGYSNLLMPI